VSFAIATETSHVKPNVPLLSRRKAHSPTPIIAPRAIRTEPKNRMRKTPVRVRCLGEASRVA
jgi:hypothetical protein